MGSASGSLIRVFPINTAAFGLRADWFSVYASKLIHPAFLLMTLMLVISIGVMVLKRFENVNFEKKVWNIPVLLGVTVFWPTLIVGIKELIDTFNTFLVTDIFRIPWNGFGFPELGSVAAVIGWPAEALARFLPNFAYWIVYAFFIIFFSFTPCSAPSSLRREFYPTKWITFLS